MLARFVCLVLLLVLVAGCGDDSSSATTHDGGAHDGGAHDGGAHDAARDGGTRSLCANVAPGGVGIASAALGSERLRLEPIAALSGAGAAAIVESKVQGFGGLIVRPGGLIALGWQGFWDVAFDGDSRWIETSTFVTGAIAGDLDRDGDQDLMILSSGVGDGGVTTRLLPWERTDGGLTQRSEVRSWPNPVLGMPFALYDVDGDGDLDLLTHEGGAPVGYLNDGAFAFTREVLGDVLSDYAKGGPLAVDMADRDGDGVQDLLLYLARYARDETDSFDVIEQAIAVLPGDGEGGFKPAILTKAAETTASGLSIADVTGDGLADIVTQQFKQKPRLHLTRSRDATRFAMPVDVEPGGQGIQFADADGDGTRDIITLDADRLVAIVTHDDSFEVRDLGIELDAKLLAFAGERASEDAAARLHVLYQCPAAAP